MRKVRFLRADECILAQMIAYDFLVKNSERCNSSKWFWYNIFSIFSIFSIFGHTRKTTLELMFSDRSAVWRKWTAINEQQKV